jgi:hypothetical protein
VIIYKTKLSNNLVTWGRELHCMHAYDPCHGTWHCINAYHPIHCSQDMPPRPRATGSTSPCCHEQGRHGPPLDGGRCRALAGWPAATVQVVLFDNYFQIWSFFANLVGQVILYVKNSSLSSGRSVSFLTGQVGVLVRVAHGLIFATFKH